MAVAGGGDKRSGAAGQDFNGIAAYAPVGGHEDHRLGDCLADQAMIEWIEVIGELWQGSQNSQMTVQDIQSPDTCPRKT